jgi:hypothetical protein
MFNPFINEDSGAPPVLPQQPSPSGQDLMATLASQVRAKQIQQLQQQSQQLQNLQPPNLSDRTQQQPGAVKSYFMNAIDMLGREASGRPTAFQEYVNNLKSQKDISPPDVPGIATQGNATQQGVQQPLNSALQSGVQSQGTPQLGQHPSAIHQRLANGLQGFSDAMLAYAHVKNQTERQQAQQGLDIQQQNANTSEAYKNLLGSQYETTTVPGPNGEPIQILKKDAEKYVASGQRVDQKRQASQLAVSAILAKAGFKLDEDGKPAPMAPAEQSDFLKSQQQKNLGSANQSNAKAAAIPQQLNINQQNANTNQMNAGSHAAMVGMAGGNLNLRQKEFDAKYGAPQVNPDGSVIPGGQQFARLSPASQTIIQQTNPVRQQLIELRDRIDSLKLGDNNQSGYLLPARVKYGLGQASDEGSLGEDISKIELSRVVGGARILKGASRAYQALTLAMQHMPNSYIDSPKLMKQKINNVIDNLDGIMQDAVKYGNKSGVTPIPPTGGFQPKTFTPDK